MKFEDYKFMQLGGNCAYLAFQPKEKRLRGPMDNTILCGINCIKLLVNNKFYDYIHNTKYITTKRPPGYFKGDCEVFSTFPNDTVRFVHNIPSGKHFFENFKQRCEAFNKFLAKVKTDDRYYFIITLNQSFIEYQTGKVKNNNKLNEVIKFLRQINLLHKTIFIGTKVVSIDYNYFDYYIKDITKYKQKIGDFNYIEITDVNVWHPQHAQKEFKEKVYNLIQELNKPKLPDSIEFTDLSYY